MSHHYPYLSWPRSKDLSAEAEVLHKYDGYSKLGSHSFFIGENAIEIILLSGSTLLILLVELLNTSIETTLNRVSLEENDLTKYAKDMGSGAVLISLLLWLVTWLLIVIY